MNRTRVSRPIESTLAPNNENRLSIYALIVATMPYSVLITTDNSYTFQSSVISIALLVVAIFFSKEKIHLTKYANIILFGFVAIIGISNLVTSFIAPYMLTGKTLIRAIMFILIILLFCLCISHIWTRRELGFVLHGVGLSVCASAFLELNQYIKMGMYGGRVYPISLTGHMIDANFFALLMVVQITCALLVALYTNRLALKIIFFLVVAVGFISVIFTGSRSGLMCLSAVIGLCTLAYFRSRAHAKLSTTLILMLFFTALVVLASNFISEWLFKRFFLNSYNDGSNEFRVQLWINAVNRWVSRPIFGYGVGNYNYYSALDWGVAETSTTTHGTFTDFLVDFGIAGVVLFASIIITIFNNVKKAHSLTLAASLPGIIFCWVIVGAERTVALWLFLIIFYILSDYLANHKYENIQDLINKESGYEH